MVPVFQSVSVAKSTTGPICCFTPKIFDLQKLTDCERLFSTSLSPFRKFAMTQTKCLLCYAKAHQYQNLNHITFFLFRWEEIILRVFSFLNEVFPKGIGEKLNIYISKKS